MKKTLLALFAFAALVSCTKDNVLENNNEAIGFNKTFIQNSVKSVSDPSFTDANLFSDFAVYGFVEGAVLFNGTTVSKSIANTDLESAWKYEGTQYWIAGAKYNFNAVAPSTNGGWTKTDASKDATTLSFVNNGTTDLLYAYASQEGKVSGNTAVALDFRHVLSKVKFSFENDYNATNATIKVSEITITNPYKSATATLNANTVWSAWASDANFKLNFGAAVNETQDDDLTAEGVNVSNSADAFAFGTTLESYNELFLIPVTDTYRFEVTFTVDLLVSGTLVKSYQHTVNADFKPEAGKSYDIKAVINAENIDPDHEQQPIEFTVNTLPGWGTTNDVDAE